MRSIKNSQSPYRSIKFGKIVSYKNEAWMKHVYIYLLINYWTGKINTLLAILPGILLHFVLVSTSAVQTQQDLT